MRWHQFDDEDLAACKRVLESGTLCSINGTEVPAFEEEFKAAMNAPHALAIVNAMAGLHCAVVASGADFGDEVIVDPLVVFASLGALYHHCTPVYCDVEPDTHLMDATRLPELLTEKTRAIIVTQLWGLCADMDAINAFATEHGLLVIEDCAHAIYATYNGGYAGTLGDAGVYSFQQSKQMALGDGGMTAMKSAEHRQIMEEMTTFGTVPARLGWNYRMNELVAAVGRCSSPARASTWRSASAQRRPTTGRSRAASGWCARRTAPAARTPTTSGPPSSRASSSASAASSSSRRSPTTACPCASATSAARPTRTTASRST